MIYKQIYYIYLQLTSLLNFYMPNIRILFCYSDIQIYYMYTNIYIHIYMCVCDWYKMWKSNKLQSSKILQSIFDNIIPFSYYLKIINNKDQQ